MYYVLWEVVSHIIGYKLYTLVHIRVLISVEVWLSEEFSDTPSMWYSSLSNDCITLHICAMSSQCLPPAGHYILYIDYAMATHEYHIM